MKAKVLLLALLMAGTTTGVMAQKQSKSTKKGEKQEMTATDRATKLTDKMTKELTLTSDEVTKVQAINLKYAQQRESEMNSMKATKQSGTKLTNEEREKMKASMKASMDAKNAELKGVLTPTQYQKFVSEQSEAVKKAKDKAQKTAMVDEFGYGESDLD